MVAAALLDVEQKTGKVFDIPIQEQIRSTKNIGINTIFSFHMSTTSNMNLDEQPVLTINILNSNINYLHNKGYIWSITYLENNILYQNDMDGNIIQLKNNNVVSEIVDPGLISPIFNDDSTHCWDECIDREWIPWHIEYVETTAWEIIAFETATAIACGLIGGAVGEIRWEAGVIVGVLCEVPTQIIILVGIPIAGHYECYETRPMCGPAFPPDKIGDFNIIKPLLSNK